MPQATPGAQQAPAGAPRERQEGARGAAVVGTVGVPVPEGQPGSVQLRCGATKGHAHPGVEDPISTRLVVASGAQGDGEPRAPG